MKPGETIPAWHSQCGGTKVLSPRQSSSAASNVVIPLILHDRNQTSITSLVNVPFVQLSAV
jgi:hypothetical protein